MKKYFAAAILLLIAAFAGCSGTAPSTVPERNAVVSNAPGTVEISFSYVRQKGIAGNQFAVWIEDRNGTFIKTLFVTNFTGKGGYAQRPESIPVWVKRSGIADNKGEADAVCGPTPYTGDCNYAWDCTDASGGAVAAGEYVFFVEGTDFWKDMLYKGVITIGDAPFKADAVLEAVSADTSDMLSSVGATFTPAK